MKVMQESGVKQMVQKMELDHIADRKLPAAKQQYRDLEEDLLYVLDERGHTVHLTDRGVDALAPDRHDEFVLPDIALEVHRIEHDHEMEAQEKLDARRAVEMEYARRSETLHVVHQLLRAYSLYEKDVNYVVTDGQVLIVDEFTGRTMPGRRWSEGLHQAVEAKERVQVKGETQTLATITIQNYFRLYEKLAGMTGTAETEENEFFEIYKLGVSVIPTNRDIVRDDRQDLIYKTRREKYNAIVDETRRLHELGLPVLVGTTSVEASETLSRLFQRAGLKHSVLNAKQNEREAEIVAGAGQPGAITIATNMAGRGTDIKLGAGVTEPRPSRVKDLDGNEVDVVETGGLHIIGSERHESRRIDRQLRGRAGRQGDPGASQFFLSLEDDLMRLFGSERIARLMDRMGAQEGEVLTHAMITRSIEGAQKRVELQNFQSRKRLLEYDDVMNQQREVVYSLRSFALEGGEELKGEARKMVERALARRIENGMADFDPRTRTRGTRRSSARTCSCTTWCRCPSSSSGRTAGSPSGRRRPRGAGVREGGGRGGVRAQARRARRGQGRRRERLRRAAAGARDAQRARREVEGPPLRPRPAAGGDPLPVVGAEGPARRVQGRGVHDVRRPDARRGGHVHRPVPEGAALVQRRRRGRRRVRRLRRLRRGRAADPDQAVQRVRHPRGHPGRRARGDGGGGVGERRERRARRQRRRGGERRGREAARAVRRARAGDRRGRAGVAGRRRGRRRRGDVRRRRRRTGARRRAARW
jgi:hypothetical protein